MALVHDLYHNIDFAVETEFGAQTATVTPANGVDLQFYERAMAVVHVGTYTSGDFTFSLEHSDDDSTYSAVGSDFWFGSDAVVDDATTDDSFLGFEYRGGKRYARLVATGANTPSVEFGVNWVLGSKRRHPVQ